MNGETCQVELPSGPTDFRTTQVKPYYEDENPITQQNGPIGEEILRTQGPEITPEEENPSLPAENPGSFLGVHIPMSQNGVFIQDPATGPVTPFKESRKKEINDLLERGAFQIVSSADVPPEIRIFNSRFVDEIKHPGTPDAYEKSRLIVQAYNDHGKEMILTQSPTIQRMSQRLILALTATLMNSISGTNLYLRDVTQAYVQSTTKLNREFYARPPHDLGIGLDDKAVLRIMKPLYGIPEAGNHWFKPTILTT
jgi:hypothetical protein